LAYQPGMPLLTIHLRGKCCPLVLYTLGQPFDDRCRPPFAVLLLTLIAPTAYLHRSQRSYCVLLIASVCFTVHIINPIHSAAYCNLLLFSTPPAPYLHSPTLSYSTTICPHFALPLVTINPVESSLHIFPIHQTLPLSLYSVISYKVKRRPWHA